MSPTLIFLSLSCSPTTRPHTTNTPTLTITSLTLPLPHHHPPDPIAGDPNTEPNGDNNNTTKPPFIFLPHHPNTTKHHHPILSKTTLQITTHNTAKNMHDIQATVLHHFNKGTDILCLQEIPSNITLDNSIPWPHHLRKLCPRQDKWHCHYRPQTPRSLLPQNPPH